jgi:hypothetical protein
VEGDVDVDQGEAEWWKSSEVMLIADSRVEVEVELLLILMMFVDDE